ncbi:Elongator complex protein 5 [Lipomyces japonicus]|uniref:Elongator complex protein 5 n=1 Tax=Lipomyces japonicus TaxID=56871 RepID=UPI0034CEF2C8
MDQHSTVLNRLVSLKDTSPFVLLLDTPRQTAKPILFEFARRATTAGHGAVFLAFETATVVDDGHGQVEFVGCNRLSFDQIHDCVRKLNRPLVLIDTLRFIPAADLARFLVPLIQSPASSTLVAVAQPGPTVVPERSFAPSATTVLSYLATTIFTVQPSDDDDDDDDDDENDGVLPLSANSAKFNVEFTHRRKSGRAVTGLFAFDYGAHAFTFKPAGKSRHAGDANEHDLVRDLTTFNLGTTEKQKQARELVELPYLQAQHTAGLATTGAIVYQYEKEDDYDEEDPYEDPF